MWGTRYRFGWTRRLTMRLRFEVRISCCLPRDFLTFCEICVCLITIAFQFSFNAVKIEGYGDAVVLDLKVQCTKFGCPGFASVGVVRLAAELHFASSFSGF